MESQVIDNKGVMDNTERISGKNLPEVDNPIIPSQEKNQKTANT